MYLIIYDNKDIIIIIIIINSNVSFGMVLFCKCVCEFGKVWAFARAEFGMGGTGICPSQKKHAFLARLSLYSTNVPQIEHTV